MDRRRWQDDVQVPAPRRREQEPSARPAPEVARVLALQRSAGNRAVAAALGRPALARFTQEDVDEMQPEDKKKVQATKKLFQDSFGFGKKYYEFEDDDWEYVLSTADTVQALEDDVKRRITRAEEQFKRANQPKPSEPSAPVRQPGAQPNTILDYQPPLRSKKQRKKPHKARPEATDIQVGFSYGPAPSQTPPPPPGHQQQQELPNLPQSMSAIQKSLVDWNGTDHTGKSGMHLSLAQVEQVITFIRDRWAAKPFKGLGSGQWNGSYQLKVAELGKVGGKSATWHLTVTKDVYDAMSADAAKS
jgi:hypothetical protein